MQTDLKIWHPWQLAEDPSTYGKRAGKFILVDESGEDEHPAALTYDTFDQAEAHAEAERRWGRDARVEIDSDSNCIVGELFPDVDGFGMQLIAYGMGKSFVAAFKNADEAFSSQRETDLEVTPDMLQILPRLRQP